jgi:hypothetical protein
MIGFGAPLVLLGFIALPAIWWLLRLTPPKPDTEIFPPLKILARIIRKDETPHKSPWWLTLLRLALASLLILALARPMLNPQNRLETTGGTLALLIDNSWISGADWDARIATARGLIDDAAARGAPVLIAFSASAPNAEIGPFDAADALERLEAAAPEPVSADRDSALARLVDAAGSFPAGSTALAILSDGLAAAEPLPAPAQGLFGEVVLFTPSARTALALTGTENGAEAMSVTAARDPSQTGAAAYTVSAFDSRGRLIASAPLTFEAGGETGMAELTLPFELRNDIATVSIDATPQAGAIRLLDSTSGRRRVALLAAAGSDAAQPLLAPLHYIRQALAPFADIVEPEGDDLDTLLDAALESRPSIMVLADIGVISPAARERLEEWAREGGTLVRFAGPRLAAADPIEDDPLLPVRVRSGERALGGTLSWSEPQPVAAFPERGPFAGLPQPQDVSVRRQVLAEPDIDTPERTWASLSDGTPLVTGRTLGRGTVALFHIAPDATWSNLPISGSFVDMLRRIIRLSVAAGTSAEAGGGTLPPLRTLDAQGRLGPPPSTAKPADAAALPSYENPPGLYGVAEGFRAMNLFPADTRFAPFELGADWPEARRAAYVSAQESDLRGPLFAGALVLLLLDMLAVLWMSGALRGVRRAAPATAALLLAALAFHPVPDARAQAAAPGETVSELEAIDAISRTRLAWVATGDAAIDEVTEAGMRGLTAFLQSRTALEPGEPKAVNPERDELAFYPLIYWPVNPAGPAPSALALSRIDAYMKNGGTVLFDTRDQLTAGLDPSSASPATLRLREMLAGMNVPPLEPVPADHVLTKSFFILQEFPGRYRGSPLWVEAANAPLQDGSPRPVRTLDGITPIMITGNDFAGAWAADAFGEPLYATVPDDPLQRQYAYRAGVNIMMVMLTGNYKADQVHVPALLERLGQ